MKLRLLTVFLLVSLAGAARAESPPADNVSAPPPAPSAVQKEMDAEVKELDPQGKLTAEQLFQLLQARERRMARNDFDPTPIIVSVSLFACSLTAFLGWLLASYRRTYLLHQTVRMMVEKGAGIPEGLLAPPRSKPSDLRRGIILSTAGLGLTVFLAVLPDASGAWGAGLTVLLLGVGHLVVWRLQTRKGLLSAALSPELPS